MATTEQTTEDATGVLVDKKTFLITFMVVLLLLWTMYTATLSESQRGCGVSRQPVVGQGDPSPFPGNQVTKETSFHGHFQKFGTKHNRR